MTIVQPKLPPLELAWAALRYIEEHPEEWDQENWGMAAPCGSTFCFAGHVVRLAGYTLLKADLYRFDEGPSLELVDAEQVPPEILLKCSLRPPRSQMNPLDVYTVHTKLLAMHLLGVSDWHAGDLFASRNSLGGLRAYVEEYLGGDPGGQA
jgi:hypothetical protein